MSLALALGLNLWVIAVALPLGLGLRAHALGGTSALWLLLALFLPLGVLGGGRRARRPGVQAGLLLVGFPLAVALPQALAPAELVTRFAPRAAFAVTALSLVGYLGAVAWALADVERRAAATPSTTRRLAQDPVPSRWRRRLRIYRGLVAVTVVFPVVLLARVDLSPGFAASLEASFGAQAARAQAAVTVGVALLWIVVLRAYVLAPLHGHLQHDRALLATMEADRRHARRGRPRPGFYFAVAVALGAMAAVVWQRAQ